MLKHILLVSDVLKKLTFSHLKKYILNQRISKNIENLRAYEVLFSSQQTNDTIL